MIAGGGNWLHDLLVGDAVYSMLSGLGDLGKSLWANITTQGQQGSILGVLSGGAHALKMALIGIVMMVFIFLMLLVLFAITYAQVIWAHIALAILTILGPIFIPFLVFEPLSFLFWGWFRAMITYSLYGVIAGAILRVFSAVGLSFVTSISAATTNPGWQSELDWLMWVLAVVPLFLAGILASLKCGELASMLVTGGGAAGSGLMGMATTGAVVASGGAGAVAKGAGSDQMKKPALKDAGAEYAEIWGEAIHTNRHLRMISGGLAIAVLLLIVVVLRIVSVEPPRPIVVRVDEVGRAEAISYEAMEAQADPLDPTTKYFLNRFIYDFYSRRRATVAENWSRSLRFLSTELANASFRHRESKCRPSRGGRSAG